MTRATLNSLANADAPASFSRRSTSPPTTGRRCEARIGEELFSAAGEGVWIEPPFDCDYGSNIKLGRRVFFNFNCAILDVAPVSIGNNVLFGPAVQLYTATYLPMRRNDGRALNSPSRLKSAMTCGSGAKRSSALGYASVGGQSSARAAW